MPRRVLMPGVVLVAALLVLAVLLAQLASAAGRPAPAPSRTVDWSSVPVGSDASWPACTPPRGTTRTLPLATAPAFVVVGVNDGLPGTRSACIARESRWAATATGGSSQPTLAYYVMAADPWTKPELRWVPHPDWPSSNRAGAIEVPVPAAFGSRASGTRCRGGHDERACAYVYGWRTALTDAALPGLRSPSTTRFWIDVEAVRTWNDDQRFNQAVIEGMVAGFTRSRAEGGVGTTTGLYSSRSEWARITGRLRAGSPLAALDQWLAIGPATKAEAVHALRHQYPLVSPGRLVMVQYVDGRFDRDVAAPAAR